MSVSVSHFMSRLRALRPVLYLIIVAAVPVATYAFKLRTQGIFACTAEGYRSDRYLGYCDASAYGDYDHGAIWFGLEPEVLRRAAQAQVLFIGSSRMEFAFSTIATDNWFRSHGISHYLMGFTHTENTTFVAPLLKRIKPDAKVYVINVDRFFSDVESGPGSQILHDRDIARSYREKRLWQPLHQYICKVPKLCGRTFAYFRSNTAGHWVVRGRGKVDTSLVADGPAGNRERWDHNASIAKQFVSELPVEHGCVVLMIVPNLATRTAEARSIADALGLDLITPPADGLRTFDGSHLDKSSAERWSQAFFDLAGPRIRHCVSSAPALAAAS